MGSLLLIRHTRPKIAKGLCYGQFDVESEAESFDRWLPPSSWNANARVYTSPLKRCQQLAQRHASSTVCVDSRLMEMSFGNWENRLWNDIPRTESDPWAEDYFYRAPPEGERLLDVLLRLKQFFSEIEGSEHDTVLVTHGGVIRLMMLVMRGEGADRLFSSEVLFGSSWLFDCLPKASDFEGLITNWDGLG